MINVHHSTQHLFKHNQHSQLSPHSQPGNRSQLSHFSRLSIHFKQLHQSVKFAHPTTAMAMEHAYQSTLAHTWLACNHSFFYSKLTIIIIWLNFISLISCDPFYTGTNCEMYLNFNTTTSVIPTMPTLVPTTPSINSTSTGTNPGVVSTTSTMKTSVPRCDFSIGLFNDGAFTTRFKIQYKIDGITQPIITSSSLPFIGQSTFNTIPYYATDIVVTIEVLGWNWFSVKEDTGINTATFCTKCYKTWGTVTGVSVDYVKC